MRNRRTSIRITLLAIAIWLGGVELSSSRDRFWQFTMNNGLKVILQENKAAPVVALQM